GARVVAARPNFWSSAAQKLAIEMLAERCAAGALERRDSSADAEFSARDRSAAPPGCRWLWPVSIAWHTSCITKKPARTKTSAYAEIGHDRSVRKYGSTTNGKVGQLFKNRAL